MSQLGFIRKVAVLGAGVMGAQIAAQLVNANVETILFDLPAKTGTLNGIVDAAIGRLLKLKPAPLVSPDRAAQIQAANYEQDLALLGGCDLVIEAIAERLDWKESLYQKIAPYIGSNATLVSNTSGLSIKSLASVLPENLRSRFCGVHFFNPPRYMKLVELIAAPQTQPAVLEQLETFLVSTLGKGVIHAKDTPNFVANRIGVFAMLAIFYHTQQYGLTLDEVDALTGALIGRPKSATYRLGDVVGLDTLSHVVKTMADNLPDDPWHRFYTLPAWMEKLIAAGALGQKTEIGLYKKVGKQILVFDPMSADYREATAEVLPEVLAILKIKNPQEKFTKLRASEHKQAQFLWAIFRDLFLYSAYHLVSIADNVRDVDLAMRWGFGWQQGPFETWQMSNWQAMVALIKADVEANVAMVNAALPGWVHELPAGPYSVKGAYSPTQKQFIPRSTLPVYQRQLFPECVLGETHQMGETVFESEAIRAWTTGDDIVVLGFKTKGNTVSLAVLDGLLEVIRMAEADYKGLILWQHNGGNFSYGADLTMVLTAVEQNEYDVLDRVLAKFQAVSMALQHSSIPTVAAVRGMVLGGGCELMMHCTRIVAATESYIGLVEAGVGLLPAGGGIKELARRAAKQAKHDDLEKFIADAFSNIAMAKTSTSAQEALALGYLQMTDTIVFNADEILTIAKQQLHALAESVYRPPLPELIEVVGISGIANRQLMLINMRDGNFISAYDYQIGCHIAAAICGGEVDRGSKVDAAWLLRLERENFVALAKQAKTQERIAYTLKNGKPLRN